MMRKILVFSILIMATAAAMAQQPTKEELERKRIELQREIEDNRKMLGATQTEKKRTVGEMIRLSKIINAREQMITNIKGEVYLVEKDIIRTYRDIDTLKKELAILKEQYAQSVVYAYKNRSNYNFLNFLFSASNFNEALKRVAYLKTYRNFREQKAKDITNTQTVMQQKIASLTGKRQQKTTALTEQSKQMTVLESEKKEKDQVVAQLKSREGELSTSIKKKEKQRKDVSNQIAAIIKREIDAARKAAAAEAAVAKKKADDEAARKKAQQSTAGNNGNTSTTPDVVKTTPPPVTAPPKKVRAASVLESTPEGQITGQQFEQNKGRLPWPVDQGLIIAGFGRVKLPTGQEFINDAVTIETSVGASVKAIFEGEVKSVFYTGDKQSVIIQHGKYFTTYSNLTGASVSRGQKISTGTVLGRAGANDDGRGEIDLRVSTENGEVNPETWIRRR